jgi:hypothetical protein
VPHFRVDDALHSHPKAQRAGDDALGLWARAGSFCMAYLTDGFVPEWWVKQQPKGIAKAKKLVAAGLWHEGVERDGEKGWQFHEFTGPGRQDSRAEVEAEREKWRKKKAGQRASSPGESPGDTSARNTRTGQKTNEIDSEFEQKQSENTRQKSQHNSQYNGENQTRNRPVENRTTRGYNDLSPGDTQGESPEESLRVTRDPTQPNPKENSGYVSSAPPETNASARPKTFTEMTTGRLESRSEPPPADPGAVSLAATEAAELVTEAIPAGRYPADVLGQLRRHVNRMLTQPNPPERAVIGECLRLWDGRDGGPGLLPHLLADAAKSLRPAHNGNHSPVKSTADLRVAQVQALKSRPSTRLELE